MVKVSFALSVSNTTPIARLSVAHSVPLAELDSRACERSLPSIGAVTRSGWFRRPSPAVLAPARSGRGAAVPTHVCMVSD